jgi:hypothetical protein
LVVSLLFLSLLDQTRPLSVIIALPLTMGIYNYHDVISDHPVNYFFYDPIEKEEQLSDGVISIVYHPVKKSFHYLSMVS